MSQGAIPQTVLCTLLLSVGLPAQSLITVGSPAIPNNGNCDPFGCASYFHLTTYQQVYAASAFLGATSILSITFYDTQILNHGLADQGTYTLSLSYTTRSPGALDLNSPTNNISGVSQTFFSGTLPSVVPGTSGSSQLTFTGTPFTYDPASGNLLLTITVASPKDIYPPLYLDQAQTNAVTSNAYFGRTNGGNDPGLITGFTMSSSQVMITLYGFKGYPDAAVPMGGLLPNSNGTIYATTVYGGTSGAGAVVQLTPPVPPSSTWSETVLYSFKNGADGSAPFAGVVNDANGYIYGTTAYGGTANSGTVFQLTPPATSGGAWTKTGLYSFTGGSDGSAPYGGLLLGPGGVLYGTTERGGNSNNGVIFQLTPPSTAGGAWTETVLYTFGGSADGAKPLCALIADAGGNLFGTTSGGGSAGAGTVFELSPPTGGATGPWTENTVYSFSAGADGANPLGRLVMDGGGALYGITHNGGTAGAGTVFSLTPGSGGAWTKTTVYNFAGGADAASPIATLVFDASGSLYGTARAGGSSGQGALYRLSPPSLTGGAWTETVLYSFTGGSDGASPSGLAISSSGILYGSTETAGPAGHGAIFEYLP